MTCITTEISVLSIYLYIDLSMDLCIRPFKRKVYERVTIFNERFMKGAPFSMKGILKGKGFGPQSGGTQLC